MANSRPAIVIATGAWHVPAHYEPMAKPLREAGFDVVTPKHQSIGIKKDPGGAMKMDAAALSRVIEQFTNRGRDVVLVMHSYGGLSGSEAVAMVNESRSARIGAGKVRRLVYLAAHVIDKNTSFAGSGRKIPGIDISEEGMMLHSDPYGRYYHEVTREAAEPALALLEPMAASALTQETTFCGWKDYGIPCVYVRCTQDTAVPMDLCDTYIAKMKDAGVQVDVETIEGGHCANYTVPDGIVKVIEKIMSSVESE